VRRTSLFLLIALTAAAPAARSEGTYARRARLRGEITDTSPKLDRWAFINDDAPPPRRLVMVVDTWPARAPADPKLLPLVVAIAYEGNGDPLLVAPDRFELTWEGAPHPERALSQEELVCDERSPPGCRGTSGHSPVFRDVRMLAHRETLPLDTSRTWPASVQFYSDPALADLRHDRLWLNAARRTSTLVYFPRPEALSDPNALLELRFVPKDDEPPAATCTFRIQRDPAVHSAAMRRARKDLETEQPRHRKHAR
jgi:hypothetical protein